MSATMKCPKCDKLATRNHGEWFCWDHGLFSEPSTDEPETPRKRAPSKSGRRGGGREWTDAELETLEHLLSSGVGYRAIGHKLGRTANAVNIARKRHGIPACSSYTLSATQIAGRMGIGCPKTVGRWIESGWLQGRRGPKRGPNRVWVTTEEALHRFLADPAYWHAWEPDVILDPDLREIVQDIAPDRWLTTGEVGKRLGVTCSAVHQWIVTGLLPARRHQNWKVPESALEGFEPPCERPRAGGAIERFSAADDAQLRQLRAQGLTWEEIAQRMDRSISSVWGRWKRLRSRRGLAVAS